MLCDITKIRLDKFNIYLLYHKYGATTKLKKQTQSANNKELVKHDHLKLINETCLQQLLYDINVHIS